MRVSGLLGFSAFFLHLKWLIRSLPEEKGKLTQSLCVETSVRKTGKNLKHGEKTRKQKEAIQGEQI